jgi:hypothetical protein
VLQRSCSSLSEYKCFFCIVIHFFQRRVTHSVLHDTSLLLDVHCAAVCVCLRWFLSIPFIFSIICTSQDVRSMTLTNGTVPACSPIEEFPTVGAHAYWRHFRKGCGHTTTVLTNLTLLPHCVILPRCTNIFPLECRWIQKTTSLFFPAGMTGVWVTYTYSGSGGTAKRDRLPGIPGNWPGAGSSGRSSCLQMTAIMVTVGPRRLLPPVS